MPLFFFILRPLQRSSSNSRLIIELLFLGSTVHLHHLMSVGVIGDFSQSEFFLVLKVNQVNEWKRQVDVHAMVEGKH